MSNQIFYSNRCQFCMKFLTEMEKHPKVMNTFRLICVDNRPSRTLPQFVQKVPTIVIVTPSTRRV